MVTTYLVTGATGYLGYNILHELTAQNKKVRALVLPGDEGKFRLPASVEVCEGNILSLDDLRRFFAVPEDTEIIVIHAAGMVSTVWNYDPRVFAVNINGTQNIINQCLQSQVKKLVYISSVHALPEQPKGEMIKESTEFDPNRIVGFYGKTKAEASRLVMDAVHKKQLPATLIFPSGLCGPYDHAVGYVSQLLIDCAQNKLPAGIVGGYDFVDVRDVAKGVVSACPQGTSGEGYILANRYIPVSEIFQNVHEQTGARLIRQFFPVWTAYTLLPFFQLYYQARKKRPLYTRYSLYTLNSNSNFSSEKARSELGYTVRPFVETIADTLTWLQAEGILKS